MTEATERKMAEPNSPAFREDRAMTTNQREKERRVFVCEEGISGVKISGCRFLWPNPAWRIWKLWEPRFVEVSDHLSTKGESNG